MQRIPLLYKTDVKSNDLTLTTRADKCGNVYHCVEYIDNNDVPQYAMFSRLDSALDFIHTNFKA